MEKLRKLQEAMLEGGKRAGDKDLKERRLKKKKAAEKRLKVRKHNCFKNNYTSSIQNWKPKIITNIQAKQ